MTPRTERRNHIRVPTRIAVLRIDGDRLEREWTRNLSADGFLLETRASFAPGRCLPVKLVPGNGEDEIALVGEVTHSRKSLPDGGSLVGLRIAKIEPRAFDAYQSLLLRGLVTANGQRSHLRLDYEGHSVWTPDGTATSMVVRVRDFAFTGARLEGSDLPEPGTHGALTFLGARGEPIFRVPAQVAWTTSTSEGDHAGVRFLANPQGRAAIAGVLRAALLKPAHAQGA